LRRINDEGFDVLAKTELPDYVTRVYLRVEFNEPTCTFFYRYEGSGPDDWTSVANDIKIDFDLAKDNGSTIIGLYAEHSSSN